MTFKAFLFVTKSAGSSNITHSPFSTIQCTADPQWKYLFTETWLNLIVIAL